MSDPQREGHQLHRYRGRIAALTAACRAARTLITGKDLEHAWVNYPAKPELTLGKMLDKALNARAANLVDDWIAVGERLPDDDITVLVACKDSDEPVWLGYHDADGWCSATDGAPINKLVTHWKQIPEAPHG